MNDKLVETVISRAGVVRVRNALNALLWLTAICLPSSILAIYLFRDDELLKYIFIASGFLPIAAAIVAFFWLLFRDPNRLQSEEFVLRQQELSIERKGRPSISIEQTVADDTLVICGKPKPEGES